MLRIILAIQEVTFFLFSQCSNMVMVDSSVLMLLEPWKCVPDSSSLFKVSLCIFVILRKFRPVSSANPSMDNYIQPTYMDWQEQRNALCSFDSRKQKEHSQIKPLLQ